MPLIDTRMAGQEGVTSAYLVDATEPAIVETGPTTSVEAVTEGLQALGVGPGDLAHIIVTHIHLDHAGGAGALAERFPRATVWVHERGAPHLVDPAKLERSVARVYGQERMRELFGPIVPLPADRVRALTDGDRIDLGGRWIEALDTPGHAGHHVALADSRADVLWSGDVLGVYLADVRVLRPATPPPEFDLELMLGSIERIRGRRPGAILFSHFGPAGGVEELCRLAAARAREWTDAVAEIMEGPADVDVVAKHLAERMRDEFPEATAKEAERYELLSSIRMNAAGIMRYLETRAEDDAGT